MGGEPADIAAAGSGAATAREGRIARCSMDRIAAIHFLLLPVSLTAKLKSRAFNRPGSF